MQGAGQAGAAAGVGGVGAEEAGAQGGAHAVLLRAHGVEEGEGGLPGGAPGDGVQGLDAGGAVANDFGAAERDEDVAGGFAEAEAGVDGGLRHGAGEGEAGQVVVAVDAQDFLDEVIGDGDVGAPGGDFDDVGGGGLPLGGEAEPAEDGAHGFGGQVEAGDLGEPLGGELDAGGRLLAGVGVDDAGVGGAARGLQQESHGAGGGEGGEFRVEALLEAEAGLRALVEGGGGTTGAGAVEVGGLQEHVGGVRFDLRVRAAHDAGEGDAGVGVCDEEVVGAELLVAAVEEGDALAGAGAADDDAALGEAVVVEGVEGLAGLQHDEVGDVDDVVDGALAGGDESLLEPVGRGADFDAPDDGDDVAQAEVRVGDLDAGGVDDGGAVLGVVGLRLADSLAGEGGDLAGDAEEGEVVGAVGGGGDVEDGLAEHVGEGGADFEGVVEDEDALVFVGEAEFALRADHAGGLDAADLGFLELAGCAVAVGVDQFRALQGEGDGLAGGDVGCAADDGLGGVAAVVDGGEAEAVGVGVGLQGEDATDADAVAPAGAGAFDVLDFGTGHGEAVGELLDGEGDVDVVGEPGEGDLHETPRNCSRKRRSFW